MNRIPIVKMALIGLLPSRLKVLWYRLNGAKIGNNVKIGLFSVVLADSITIGDNTKIGPLSFIRARKFTAGNRVSIASTVAIDTGEVKIGHDSVIMEQVVIGGMKTPRSKITIGERVKIFSYSFLNPTEEILIEDEVGVGGANYIFTHGTWPSALDGYPYSFGKVTIRKGVWLPWRVFIFPGVEIGEKSILTAGAVVSSSIPPHSLAAGMPARVISTGGAFIKNMTESEKLELMDKILTEYHGWLEYSGWTAERSGDIAEGCTISLSRDSVSAKIIFVSKAVDSVGDLGANDVVIAWSGISGEKLSQYTWFDIAKRECNFGKSPLFDETRNFMSRYGVRFSVFGEKSI